jgi:hypothetical protein
MVNDYAVIESIKIFESIAISTEYFQIGLIFLTRWKSSNKRTGLKLYFNCLIAEELLNFIHIKINVFCCFFVDASVCTFQTNWAICIVVRTEVKFILVVYFFYASFKLNIVFFIKTSSQFRIKN